MTSIGFGLGIRDGFSCVLRVFLVKPVTSFEGLFDVLRVVVCIGELRAGGIGIGSSEDEQGHVSGVSLSEWG
ncbi:hypothetical protein D3261_01225 [Halococcus sp. IIIV-5B]|nr:hypothetical protein D3261_01225 [Halococcus sp. IIIV-5B]